jgi:two-component system, OmpR family, KDP operon response regulator KdpE
MSVVTPVSPLVLLIEDEAPMRKFLRSFLTGAGYRLIEAVTGQEALQLAAHHPPDVVILDLGLPDMDGQDVLREMREWSKAPIIILSVRDQDLQKITALDNGADDYLTKPFSSGELLARIRAALRRSAAGQSSSEVTSYQVDNLSVDLSTRKVFLQGQEVHLTPIEFKLLTILLRHSNRVLTHQYLLKEVWGPKRAENTPHLRVFMAGLRRKIEVDPARPRHLMTEQGVGYRFVVD